MEKYSICCSAPPMYELHDTGEYEVFGICSDCKDHSEFEDWEETDG